MSDLFLQHWISQNAERDYPLQDGVSRIADNGVTLPNDILVDCQITVPTISGDVFISSVTVSPKLVSITFAGLVEAVGRPLGVVTVVKPCQVGYHYPIEAIFPGVGGWVTFGPGVEGELLNLIFSSAANTMLAPGVVTYDDFPVLSLQELCSPELSNLVLLKGGSGIEIVGGIRNIDGIDRRCIIISTAKDLDANQLAAFSGPCGGRPATNTCGKTPITSINGVEPNCDGNIFIDVIGCGIEESSSSMGPDAYYTTEDHTLLIIPGPTLTEACPLERIPNANGCLPDEECSDSSLGSLSSLSSEISSESSSSSIEIPPDGYCGDIADVAPPSVTPPNGYDFVLQIDTLTKTTFFNLRRPTTCWSYDGCLFEYQQKGYSGMALAVSSCLDSCKDLILRTQFQVEAETDSNVAAYLIFGYQYHPSAPSYNYAGVNFGAKSLGIYRYNAGFGVTELISSNGVLDGGDTRRSFANPEIYLRYANSATGQLLTYDMFAIITESPIDPSQYLIGFWMRWTDPTGEDYPGWPVGFNPADPNTNTEPWLRTYVPKTRVREFVDGYFGVGAKASQPASKVRFNSFEAQWIDRSGLGSNKLRGASSPVSIGKILWRDCNLVTNNMIYNYQADRAINGGPGINSPVTTIWDNLVSEE